MDVRVRCILAVLLCLSLATPGGAKDEGRFDIRSAFAELEDDVFYLNGRIDYHLGKGALEALETDCAERGFELKRVASGYRFQVGQEMSPWVSRLWEERPPRYSRALMETLALIVYRQPITRGDIEEIRGVSVSSNIIRQLLERDWVRVVGHRDVPGRPAMFGTTKGFLDYFSLKKLDDLPPLADLSDWESLRVQLDLPDVEGQLEGGVDDHHPAGGLGS